MATITKRLYHFNNSLKDMAGQYDGVITDGKGNGYEFIQDDYTRTKHGYGLHLKPGTVIDLGQIQMQKTVSTFIEFWLYVDEPDPRVTNTSSLPWYFQLYYSDKYWIGVYDYYTNKTYNNALRFCSRFGNATTYNSSTAPTGRTQYANFSISRKTLHYVVLQYVQENQRWWTYVDGERVLITSTAYDAMVNQTFNLRLGIAYHTSTNASDQIANFIISDLRILTGTLLWMGQTASSSPEQIGRALQLPKYPYSLTENMRQDVIRMVATRNSAYDLCNNLWHFGSDVEIVKGGYFNEYCFRLRGKEGISLINSHLLYNVLNNWDFTISFWFYVETSSAWEYILSFGNDNKSLQLSDFNAVNYPGVRDKLNVNKYTFKSKSTRPTGEWCHLALIQYGTKGYTYMFLNGTQVAKYTGNMEFELSDLRIGYNYGQASYSILIDDLFINRLSTDTWDKAEITKPSAPFTWAPHVFDEREYNFMKLTFNYENDFFKDKNRPQIRGMSPHQSCIYSGCYHNANFSFDFTKNWTVAFEYKFDPESSRASDWNTLFAFGSHASFASDNTELGLNTYAMKHDEGLGNIIPGYDWHKYILHGNAHTQYIYIFKDGYHIQNISLKELAKSSINCCYIGGGGWYTEIFGYIRNLSIVGANGTAENQVLVDIDGTSLINKGSINMEGSATALNTTIVDDADASWVINNVNADYTKALQIPKSNGYAQVSKIFLFGDTDFKIDIVWVVEDGTEKWGSPWSFIHDQFNMIRAVVNPDVMKIECLINGVSYTQNLDWRISTGGTRRFHTVIDFDQQRNLWSVNGDSGETNSTEYNFYCKPSTNISYSLLIGATYDRVFLKTGKFKGSIDEMATDATIRPKLKIDSDNPLFLY